MKGDTRESRAQKSKVRKLARAKLRSRAMSLRVAGRTMVQIAKAMDVSIPTVNKLLGESLQEFQAEEKEACQKLRATTCARLDVMVSKLWALVQQGDASAILAVVKIEERRAKLLGLDKPAQVKVSVELDAASELELIAIAKRMGLPYQLPVLPSHGLDEIQPVIPVEAYTVSPSVSVPTVSPATSLDSPAPDAPEPSDAPPPIPEGFLPGLS
jgi:hypothetical protein